MNRDKQIRSHQFPQMPLHIVQDTRTRGNNGARFQRLFNSSSDQAEGRDNACRLKSSEVGAVPASDPLQIESEAYARGFCKGEQDGMQAAEKRIQRAIELFAAAAEGLTRMQQTFARESEARLVELALAIGRKIVGYEIATNRHVVVNIAREALKDAGSLQEVTLKMNPADLKFLEENQVPPSRLAPHIRQVQFEADDSIDSGGCVIESACGVIDAQVDSQLQLIEKAFQTELNKINESES